MAIENARLYQEVSHHLEEVQLLNNVALAATSTLDFDEVVRRGMMALLGTRNFERVNILLLDEERNDLWLHPRWLTATYSPGGQAFASRSAKALQGW